MISIVRPKKRVAIGLTLARADRSDWYHADHDAHASLYSGFRRGAEFKLSQPNAVQNCWLSRHYSRLIYSIKLSRRYGSSVRDLFPRRHLGERVRWVPVPATRSRHQRACSGFGRTRRRHVSGRTLHGRDALEAKSRSDWAIDRRSNNGNQPRETGLSFTRGGAGACHVPRSVAVRRPHGGW